MSTPITISDSVAITALHGLEDAEREIAEYQAVCGPGSAWDRLRNQNRRAQGRLREGLFQSPVFRAWARDCHILTRAEMRRSA